MSEYPSDFEIRSLRPAFDYPELLALLNDVAVTHGLPGVSEEDLRLQQELPGHDQGADSWVGVRTDGPMVAFADVWAAPGTTYADLTLAVHPSERHNSMLGELLSAATGRARELQRTSVLTYAAGGDHQLTGFLVAEGFERVNGYRRMRATMAEKPKAMISNGFTLSTYAELEQPELITEASDHCYQDLWGHKAADAGIAALVLDSFPHDGIFLLFDPEGHVAGMTKVSQLDNASNAGTTGYLDAPGVVLRYRNSDLYQVLALAGLGWLYERGHKRVLLESWGDAQWIIAGYENLGFELSLELSGFVLNL